MIKKGLYYVEKMKELTEPQLKNIKEKLIKFKNELVRENRIKKYNDIYNAWYYGSITYNGIKDFRYLFNEDEHEDKITYKESPFKSIIVDIRNKLSKNGDKLIKKGLYYVEEMKELTESQVNNIKEKLSKFKSELIRKIKLIIVLKKILIIIMTSKILDICLMNMKMKMNMKISDICSMELHSMNMKM